jgi:peroxidase
LDLVALNVQRGRDHGLPSYNQYRDLCRLGRARDFGDLAPIINPRKIGNLERIYGNVDDIDLYIGGLHETPVPGALVGGFDTILKIINVSNTIHMVRILI